MDNLMTLLIAYKKTTEELIESLRSDDFDRLEPLLDKKQGLIESLQGLDYTKEEFTCIAGDLGITRLEKKLKSIMEEKLNDTRKEIKKTVSGRSMNNAYNKSFNVDPIFFNKKI